MSDPQARAGTSPLPSFKEVAGHLHALQSSLGAYVQCDTRQDEKGKAAHSARVTGAFRKIVATYHSLAPDSQWDLVGPIQSLHATIVTLGIPLGPCKLEPPMSPPPAEDEPPPSSVALDEGE